MREIKNQTHTRFEYLYRDAANYKVYGHLLLEGSLSAEDQSELVARLEDDEFFIAEQIGIPALYQPLYEISGGITSSDHCWHEFYRISRLETPPPKEQIWGTAEELCARFRDVSDWNLRFSPHVCVDESEQIADSPPLSS